MTTLARAVQNLGRSGPVLREASASGNLRVLVSLLGPAYRGLVMHEARGAPSTAMPAGHATVFDWSYLRDRPQLTRLYEAAKSSQWNASSDLDWSISVDPMDPERPLVPEDFHPISTTEAVPWLDAKLYGSSQVVDEGRHVEVFHGYLTRKLEKLYEINDNLYTIVDALMTDSRWDVKFLGMQIMIEGLALGAFGTFRQITGEPLLKQLLTRIITDEARHVHFGVLALQECLRGLTERERREREDWAFEVSLLLRNRFLAWEFYEEHWAHAFRRSEWERLSAESKLMGSFRQTMFKRIVPNLKRIGLLSERIRPRYDALGLLAYEGGRAAPDLTAADLLEDR